MSIFILSKKSEIIKKNQIPFFVLFFVPLYATYLKGTEQITSPENNQYNESAEPDNHLDTEQHRFGIVPKEQDS
jgi:hypothetical protein